MASDDVFYVRNWRPNRVSFRYAGLKYLLERRGAREDTAALPSVAKSDPTVARWLKNGQLEEINQENFIELATRVGDDEVRPLLKSSEVNKVNVPIEQPHSPTPTVVAKDPKTGKSIFDDEAKKQQYMSPKLQWATPPLSTEEELAKKRIAPKRTRAKKPEVGLND